MIRENNITVLGGSFNPIHNGHVEMARCAATQYNLEHVVFMPNKSTYYKNNDCFASDEDRINMIKLAIDDYPYMSVSDMEIKRGGVTHTSSARTGSPSWKNIPLSAWPTTSVNSLKREASPSQPSPTSPLPAPCGM